MSNIVGIEQHSKLRRLGFPMVEEYKDSNTMESVICKSPLPYCEVLMRLPKLRGDITVSEALDYLREEKGIACGAHPYARHNNDGKFICWDYTYAAFDGEKDLFGDEINYKQFIHPTYHLAASALLTAVLDYLEKKGEDE